VYVLAHTRSEIRGYTPGVVSFLREPLAPKRALLNRRISEGELFFPGFGRMNFKGETVGGPPREINLPGNNSRKRIILPGGNPQTRA